MGVSSIILGRPWLYDHDITLYGHSNSCSLTHNGKKIVIHSSPPRDPIKRGSSQLEEKKTGMNLITAKEMEKELSEGNQVWILTSKDTSEPGPKEYPPEVTELLKEFQDIFLGDLPDHLQPLRDIQHVIDLVPGATLPNLPHYRMNLIEHQELQ